MITLHIVILRPNLVIVLFLCCCYRFVDIEQTPGCLNPGGDASVPRYDDRLEEEIKQRYH